MNGIDYSALALYVFKILISIPDLFLLIQGNMIWQFFGLIGSSQSKLHDVLALSGFLLGTNISGIHFGNTLRPLAFTKNL